MKNDETFSQLKWTLAIVNPEKVMSDFNTNHHQQKPSIPSKPDPVVIPKLSFFVAALAACLVIQISPSVFP